MRADRRLAAPNAVASRGPRSWSRSPRSAGASGRATALGARSAVADAADMVAAFRRIGLPVLINPPRVMYAGAPALALTASMICIASTRGGIGRLGRARSSGVRRIVWSVSGDGRQAAAAGRACICLATATAGSWPPAAAVHHPPLRHVTYTPACGATAGSRGYTGGRTGWPPARALQLSRVRSPSSVCAPSEPRRRGARRLAISAGLFDDAAGDARPAAAERLRLVAVVVAARMDHERAPLGIRHFEARCRERRLRGAVGRHLEHREIALVAISSGPACFSVLSGS